MYKGKKKGFLQIINTRDEVFAFHSTTWKTHRHTIIPNHFYQDDLFKAASLSFSCVIASISKRNLSTLDNATRIWWYEDNIRLLILFHTSPAVWNNTQRSTLSYEVLLNSAVKSISNCNSFDKRFHKSSCHVWVQLSQCITHTLEE